MFLIGLLLGYDHTIENLEASSKAKPKKQNDKQLNFSDDSFFNGDDFNTPFEEAIEFLKSKIPMTKTEWNELEKKLRFRAFTVGALSEADAIEKVKQALIDNLEKGEPFYKAWEKFKDIAKSDGKDYFARYFETVYRTNIQSAYNAGRLMQYKNNTPPAWELLFMEDSRMSDICTNLMNEVGRRAIKSDDAFWSTVGFPPYHFNCRTTFRAVYPDELQTDKITLIEPQNPAPLTNGFGGDPLDKESFWKLTDTMIERAGKYGITADIVAQARELDMQSYFPELLQGYKIEYEPKGAGYVHVAKNWEYSKKEMDVAKCLADAGYKIYLLPRNQLTKSPDMIINDEIGELKECSSLTSIDNNLRQAIHQRARVPVLSLTFNTSLNKITPIISRRLERSKNEVKYILVILNNLIYKL